MPQVLLINPSDRKGSTMAKSKRTPAQQRATRKMIAANKARAKSTRRVSRAKPAKSRAMRSAPEHITIVNPKPARRKARRSHPITSARAASDAGRKLRYRRKNPVGGFFSDTLIPSAVGGAGALTLDVLLGVLPIPAQFKTGPMAPVVKLAGAVGLGFLASKVAPKRVANQIAAGAITVTLYGVAKQMLVKVGGGKIPGLGEYVGEMYVEPVAVGEYVGEYVGALPDETVGYPNAGMIVGDLQPDGSVEGYETGVYR